MLRVDEIVLREIRLPLRERFEISSGATSERRICLLELKASDGTETWSECVAPERPNYSPETIDTAWLAIREWLAPKILGREFAGPREIHPALAEGVCGHRMARAALEMGLWALAALREGRPLADLLGGTRERVATGISLGIQTSPEALAGKAGAALAAGYRKVKLKIRPGADAAYLAAVREAVGADAPLAADANASYSLSRLGELEALDDFGLLMLEQPLERSDLVRHARLQERLRTPICLDESITGPERTEDMLSLGSGRIVNIKPGRVGGYLPSLRIHDLCRDRDLPVWCGGMLESGVGRAYNVALASLPNFRLPGDLSPSQRYWEEDIVDPPWTMSSDGMVVVPRDRPGIGVTVDRDRVAEVTVRTERLSGAAAVSPAAP